MLELYWINKYKYPEDWELFVAENEEDLFRQYNELHKENYDLNYFLENFEYNFIDQIGKYKILFEKVE